MSVRTVTCTGCGDRFEREIPDGLTGHYRELLERTPAVCDVCGDRLDEADEAERQQREAEELEKRVKARRKMSGIPAALQGLSWQQAERGNRPELVAAARAWGAGELAGLLLTGPVGTGKTFLAAVAAWQRTESKPVRWFSVPTLFALLGLSFENDARDEAQLVLSGKQSLVLDDIDKVKATEYAAGQLFCAIDNRLTAGTGLLITTNLALSTIADRYHEPYGEAIASRLAGYCQQFVVDGSDRRTERLAA